MIGGSGLTVVHPYDDARVIAGQGTAALELVEELPDLDVVLAEVSGPAVDTLVRSNYYYIATTIPGGMYKGTAGDTKTFGAVAVMMAGQVIEHDVIHTAIKSVFENFEEFKGLHDSFGDLTKKAMTTQGIQVPIHGGSDRYLREVGLR